MASQRDVKARIASVKNVGKITRAMEMVAAARLRKAEQRIEALRPYAEGIRRMTRRAVQASERVPNFPVLEQREEEKRVGLLLVTGDRGLAGSFNSQILRAGTRAARELRADGREAVWYASGRRGASSLNFRGHDVADSWIGFTDRPAYSNAREIADAVVAAYVDGQVDRVDIFYNGYVSALTQEVRRETLLPLQEAAVIGGEDGEPEGPADTVREGEQPDHTRALWIYEPDPEEILRRLVPEYVQISIFRALLESTASEHGARMTAMRSASENASDLVADLTLEANRQRQAEITQQLMEVVAGAEGLR